MAAMKLVLSLCAFVLTVDYTVVQGSYLDVPRIHFNGTFRADVNSRNNWPCNFDIDRDLYSHQEWNFNGTNEWQFALVLVTSVVDSKGKMVKDSPLLGARVFSNDNGPFAKIVDFDVDYQVSSIYGLKFVLKMMTSKGPKVLFTGDWTTSVIVQDIWPKMKCFKSKCLVHHDEILGTQSTTRITNITWSEEEAIQELKAATRCADCTGELSVAISISYFSQTVFTLGHLQGTIGVAKKGEPLNVGGERKLETADPRNLTFPRSHPCNNVSQSDQLPWTNAAPFKVDEARNALVVDLSNALPVFQHSYGLPIDIGTLRYGLLLEGNTVQTFGDPIPYRNLSMWKLYGGIFEQALDSVTLDKIKRSSLVVVMETTEPTELGSDEGSDTSLMWTFFSTLFYPIYKIFSAITHLFLVYPISVLFHSPDASESSTKLVLKETPYFIRPMGFYMDRLEYSDSNGPPKHNTSDMTLLVTRYGKPAPNVMIAVRGTINEQNQPVLPENGVIPVESKRKTDKDGLVTFTFAVNKPIPIRRHYFCNPCSGESDPCSRKNNPCDADVDYTPVSNDYTVTRPRIFETEDHFLRGKTLVLKDEGEDMGAPYSLPIDGQVYNFFYCIGEECSTPEGSLYIYKALLSFLAFSTVEYTRPYTWVGDVKPIFDQVYHIHHIMRTILNMRNFTEVTLPNNVHLLKLSVNKSILDPNYMPVTRDLSPTKRDMILEWLDNKHPYSKNSEVDPTSEFNPPRCVMMVIPFDTHNEPYFQNIFHVDDYDKYIKNPPRPLFGFRSEGEPNPECTIEALKEQLQLAVQIEFYTLPLYLTSLYSIKKGENLGAYELIRSVAMQEMLHFALAANMLIAIGGRVKIDDPSVVPKFPATGLPGGALPHLNVSLSRFTLRHLYKVFMGVETPELSSAAIDPHFALFTIGYLYTEIRLCMETLGNEIFQPETVSKQVRWPWEEPQVIGHIYPVTDFKSANDSINEIIEQGEGASRLDPNDRVKGQYAHFYRFEEIVCQNRLTFTEHGYAFDGEPIPYKPRGVWPMRDNPSKDSIVPGTECYTEAKVFHRIYRNFLRVLQETFDGAPEKIVQAVELMEALQLHAKKTMWTRYNKYTSCGPVWDYEWEEDDSYIV